MHLCLGCAIPLTKQQPWCGQCQTNPPTHKLITCANYATPLKQLITSLKYKDNQLVADELARHLARRVRLLIATDLLSKPHYLIAVPLHPKRLRQRGYNQAQLIAQGLSRDLDIELLDGVERVINTPTQTSLDAAARMRNLRGAFTLNTTLPAGTIALIDDVFTTGSTMQELAATITRQHPRQIQFWSVAHTTIE